MLYYLLLFLSLLLLFERLLLLTLPPSLPPSLSVPTLKGMIVAAWLSKHFPDLVEPQFTASMEDSLDR